MQSHSTVSAMRIQHPLERISISRPTLRGAGNINLLASPVECGSLPGYPIVVPSQGRPQPHPPIASHIYSPSFQRTKQAAPYVCLARPPTQNRHFSAHSQAHIRSGSDPANVMSRQDPLSAQTTPELMSMDSTLVPSPPPQTPPHASAPAQPNPVPTRRVSATSASSTHMRVRSDGSKAYRCPYPGCGKEFAQLYNVKPHFLLHSNLRPFTCTSCDASFARSTDLARHFKTVHKGFKEYQCWQCGDGFSRKDSLVRHGKSCRGPLPH